MYITELTVPLEPSLAEELIDFWEETFGISFAQQRGILAGEEIKHNRDLIYIVRKEGRLAGTCHLTVGTAMSEIGGVGEVAVSPEFRRRGIAESLCKRARNTFRDCGGKGLFLATDEENAARVYSRIGWRKVSGSNVMLLTDDGKTLQAFLVDHLSGKSRVAVTAATPSDRIAIIPLLVSPHDSCVLDANVGIYSTRYALQISCMGLYPQYQELREDGRGEWFAARTIDGRVVGLSTARINSDGIARLDSFVHHCHADSQGLLISQAAHWAADHEAVAIEAIIAIADNWKLSSFEAMGFQNAGETTPLNLNGQVVRAVRLEKALVDQQVWWADSPHRLRDPSHGQAARGVEAE